MTLEQRLADTLASARQNVATISKDAIIHLIDLTLLEASASSHDIIALAGKAQRHKTAAICILPDQLDCILQPVDVKIATVANFPAGEEPEHQVLSLIENAATLHHVNEIDYVFPYQTYLAGHENTALSHCYAAYQACQQHKLTFKVILETGALPSMGAVYDMSAAIITSGCDFLKTSTGKIAVGATISAVFSMLSAIIDCNRPCGIKVSGGIRTIDDALPYLQIAEYMMHQRIENTWFRLGASSLIDNLLTS